MYTEKTTVNPAAATAEFWAEVIQTNYTPKRATEETAREIQQTARELAALCAALMADGRRQVFAVCEKEPRNLDSGNHYYSIFYNTPAGPERFWIPYEPVMKVCHMAFSSARDRNLPARVFKSGAIGMSRLLDATNALFSFIRRHSGLYAQIETL